MPELNSLPAEMESFLGRGWQIEADIPFLGENSSEKMDLYLPGKDIPARRAAILVIHGGGWHLGDKRNLRELGMVEALVEAGYVCASINYRIAAEPTRNWPGCLEDCQAAARYLRAEAEHYGIDSDRIGAIGGSAGGTMALLLGLPVNEAVGARVRTVAALYPPTDLLTTPWDCENLFGVSRKDDPAIYREASPLHLVTADFPPTLLIHGTADETVPLDQSERLVAVMKEHGISHELIVVQGAPHTFRLADEYGDFRETIVRFFNSTL